MRLDKLSFCAWVLVFSLILIGNLVVMFSSDAQGSTNCSRQASSGDCPTSSGGEKTSNNDNSGNIEPQIPSVLPFP